MSRLAIGFLLRSKHLLISWLQSPSAVILEPKKIKSVTVSIVSPSLCHEVVGLIAMMGPDAMILVFWILSFKPTFSLSSFTFIKRLFNSSLSIIRVLKFRSIESVMLSNQLILCCPLLLRSQSFPASQSFPMSQLLAWGGQNIGASASVLLVDIQGWFPFRLTGLKSLQSREFSGVFNTTIWKHQFFGAQPSL